VTCLAICITPSPTNAHCGACHVTFGSVSGFDRHRRGGECLDPAGLGFVRDRNGIWRYASPDGLAAWPQRAAAPAIPLDSRRTS
jgi:hypothetical protein